MLWAGDAFGQEAVPTDISTPDYSPLSPREVQILQSGQTTTAPAAGDVSAPDSSAPQSGTLSQTPRRFQYNLLLSERTVFDDNIGISHFDRRSDLYFSLEPALVLGFGTPESISSFSFTYHPSVSLFINNSQDDAVQHILRLQGAHTFGHLALTLSQDVQILDGSDLSTLSDQTGHNANTDVGGRIKHDIYTTNLNGSYDLTGKTFLTSAASLMVDDYPGGQIGSKNISGNFFLNYQYRPKLVVGLGGAGGFNTVDSGSPDQVYEQANVRAAYTATAKTSFSGTVGLEFREFQNNSRGVYVTPVYTLSGNYAPFDGTTVTLSGSRRVANSGSLAGQDYTSTNINFGLRQRLLSRGTLGISVGYENAEYFSTINGISANRIDDYYFIEPSLDVRITRFWTAGAYYLRRQNTSSLDFFGFYDNQVGFRTVLTF